MTEFSMQNYEKDLETFTRSYMNTALWSSVTDDSEEEMPITDEHTINDIDPETVQHMKDTCRLFFEVGGYNEILNDAPSLPGDAKDKWDLAGHDFWLTQNNHGAGFWDGDWQKGEELTQLSDKFDENTLYVGDDNKIHGMNPELDDIKSKQKNQSKKRPKL